MMRFGKVSLTKLMVIILGQRTFAPSWEQNSTWADARIPSVSPLAFAPRSRSKSLQFHLLNLSWATSETVLHYTIVFEKKIHEIFVDQDEQRVLPIIVWTSIAVRLVKHDPWSSPASDVTEHDVILHSSHFTAVRWSQGSMPLKKAAHDTYSSNFLVHTLRQTDLTKEGLSKWRLWPLRPAVSRTREGADWPKGCNHWSPTANQWFFDFIQTRDTLSTSGEHLGVAKVKSIPPIPKSMRSVNGDRNGANLKKWSVLLRWVAPCLSTGRCKESSRDSWKMKIRRAPSSKSMLADDAKCVDGDRTEATAVFRSTSVELVDVCTSTRYAHVGVRGCKSWSLLRMACGTAGVVGLLATETRMVVLSAVKAPWFRATGGDVLCTQHRWWLWMNAWRLSTSGTTGHLNVEYV